MMFATKRRILETPESQNFEGDLKGHGANEMWSDAQVFDSTLALPRRFWLPAQIAAERRQSWPVFFALWFVIGAISAYDAFLAMKFRSELPLMERNLLGRVLLYLDNDGPALFLTVKFLGTILALGILANLFHLRPQWAMKVAYGVTVFQIGLLLYLTWAGPGPW